MDQVHERLVPSRGPPRVAVVILHYQGFETLANCIESVVGSEYPNLTVVLVDNGSIDGSTDEAEKKYGNRINVLKLGKNLGFVRGYNAALRQVQADYVVLLNDDTVVDPYWLNSLVSAAESDPGIAACQPKLRWLSQPSYFEYNGACGGMLDMCAVPFTRGRLFDKAEEDIGQYDTNIDVFWASGAAMFLRYSALEEAGFLEDLFYAHMEEIDLSWRLRLRGYRVVSVPYSLVYHQGGSTGLDSKSFLKHRNNLFMMVKNYSTRSLVKYLPMRFMMDIGSVVYSTINRRAKMDTGGLRAYVWLVRNMRKVVMRRREIQSRRVVSDETILRSMAKPNVVFQYFLLKRLRFSQLGGLPLPTRKYLNGVPPEMIGKTETVAVQSIF